MTVSGLLVVDCWWIWSRIWKFPTLPCWKAFFRSHHKFLIFQSWELDYSLIGYFPLTYFYWLSHCLSKTSPKSEFPKMAFFHRPPYHNFQVFQRIFVVREVKIFLDNLQPNNRWKADFECAINHSFNIWLNRKADFQSRSWFLSLQTKRKNMLQNLIYKRILPRNHKDLVTYIFLLRGVKEFKHYLEQIINSAGFHVSTWEH